MVSINFNGSNYLLWSHNFFPHCLACASCRSLVLMPTVEFHCSLISYYCNEQWSIIIVRDRSQHRIHSMTETWPIDYWLDPLFSYRECSCTCDQVHNISIDVVDSSNFVCSSSWTRIYDLKQDLSILTKGSPTMTDHIKNINPSSNLLQQLANRSRHRILLITPQWFGS